MAVIGGIALLCGYQILDWSFLKTHGAHKISLSPTIKSLYGVMTLTVFVRSNGPQ